MALEVGQIGYEIEWLLFIVPNTSYNRLFA